MTTTTQRMMYPTKTTVSMIMFRCSRQQQQQLVHRNYYNEFNQLKTLVGSILTQHNTKGPLLHLQNHIHHRHQNHHLQRRCMSNTSGGGKRQNWKQQQKSSNITASTSTIQQQQQQQPSVSSSSSSIKILSKPPNEKMIFRDDNNNKKKFQFPDRVKENELTRLQIQIQDLHKAGKYSKALTVSETLVKDTIAHFGQDHPATAAAYNNLGLMRKLQGEFDNARNDYMKALDVYREIVGSDHSSYANVLHNLGNLNRAQIHVDTSLSATDRLSLVESALKYLENAYNVRLAELGPVHPHTVSSRSSWGATLAAQILHYHKMTSTLSSGGDLMRKRFYISILPTDVTETAWIAAEEHLREALTTAIDNPRGMTIEKATATNTNAPPQRGKRKIKPTSKVDEASTNTTKTIQTISAASAAQNLAVFLKSRATTVQPYEIKWLNEAENLYRQALHVQGILLLPAVTKSNSTTTKGKSKKERQLHPDMYATKHSLAELLETMGNLDAANILRQEILDTLDPVSIGSVVSDTDRESSSSSTTTTSSSSSESVVDDVDENDDDDSGTKESNVENNNNNEHPIETNDEISDDNVSIDKGDDGNNDDDDDNNNNDVIIPNMTTTKE